MASRTSTPNSRSRSSTASSGSSDTTMLDAPPHSPSRPVRLRHPSTSNPSAGSQPASSDPAFSLLLSLPRELRAAVYFYALTSPFPFWWPHQAPMKQDVGVSLLRTNKQIYRESVKILYSENLFLFTHPSDCNIFRVIASPFSEHITCVYFQIREKDLRLWTTYLGSKSLERSLKFDLPKLKTLWIFMRCGSLSTPAMLGQLGQGGMHAPAGLAPGVAVHVQAVQNALGQQVHALQQQVQNLGNALPQLGQQQQHAGGAAPNSMNQIPPPPPPAPAMPFIQFAQGGLQHHQGQIIAPHVHPHGAQNNPPLAPGQQQIPQQNNQGLPPFQAPQGGVQIAPQHQQPQAPAQGANPAPHQQQQPHPNTLYNSFLRFEREVGIESLCLSLQETRRKQTEVKIVCVMRIPRREVERLIQVYPDELSLDKYRDARTRFRKLHGVEVSLEVSGYEVGGGQGGGVDA